MAAELERKVEALLFLSPQPLAVVDLAGALEADQAEVEAALAAVGQRYREGLSGIHLREVAGGFTFASDPIADEPARRLFGRERKANLSPAQLETLAIIAYLQPVSRPEIARIRGVSADSAVAALLERELIEEAGRTQLGATLYRTTATFLKRFGLVSLEQLPDPSRYDPTPQQLASLRERLFAAGERRAAAAPPLELDAGLENGAAE